MSTTGGKPKTIRRKTTKKTTAKRKPNVHIMKKVSVTGPLADLIGGSPRSRGQIVKAVWDYIKKNGLQTQVGGKGGYIKPDAKLGKVLGTSSTVHQTKMMKPIFKYVGK